MAENVQKIPSWLMESQNYTALKDKDNFVDQSCLSFVRLLAKIKAREGEISQNRTNPVSSLLFLFSMILMTALAKNVLFVYIVCAGVIVRISLLKPKVMLSVLKGTFAAVLFSVIILLPSILLERNFRPLLISIRVFASVSMVGIFSWSVKWNKLTSGLKSLHVPDLFLFLMDTTMKYIVLLGQECIELLQALKCRLIGKNHEKGKALGGVLGVTFLKSREMSEELYQAMCCRGFDGNYYKEKRKNERNPQLILKSLLKWIIAGAFLALFIYLEGV